MGVLIERIKLSNMVYGTDIPDVYKKNSLFLYEKYKESDKDIKALNKGDMQIGCFYFLHYKDDSNWMKYSPIFTVDFKKFDNMIVILGVNFNFIPIEIRASIFDKFIIEKDFEQDNILEVDYTGMYNELRRYGFEYSICEYNLAQVVMVHKISLDTLPRFLYAGHPINKYDPNKLMEIWSSKIETSEKRHSELMSSLLDEFYNISEDVNIKYDVLSKHIQRLQKSYGKYGK